MGQFVQKLFGTGSSRKAEAAAAEERARQAAENQKIQEINQAQTIQSQGQQAAELDKGISASRKAMRGRRLLMDTGDAKMTVG